MNEAFWAKTRGAPPHSVWHHYIQIDSVMAAKCKRKSAGQPGSRHFQDAPKLGRICKSCSGTSKAGRRNLDASMPPRAFEAFSSGKSLAEVGLLIGRGPTATRGLIMAECLRRGVDYSAIVASHQTNGRFKMWARRRSEPIPDVYLNAAISQ